MNGFRLFLSFETRIRHHRLLFILSHFLNEVVGSSEFRVQIVNLIPSPIIMKHAIESPTQNAESGDGDQKAWNPGISLYGTFVFCDLDVVFEAYCK